MRRGWALLVGGFAVALAMLAPASGAFADVTVGPTFTILYVKGDDGPNQIAVECINGIVTVNGVPAAGGEVSCVDLQKLSVFGFGGDDAISLSGFRAGHGSGGLDPGALFGSQQPPTLTASGGDGNDTITGDSTLEDLNGNAGNDVISAPGALFAFLSGGPGDDQLFGKSLFLDFMAGGPGADRLNADTRASISLGGPGADTIVGGSLTDIATGGGGPDKVVGKSGQDVLGGQAGSDSIFGGSGKDTLAGGPGRDRIRSGPGDDKVFEGGFPRHRHLLSSGLGHLLDSLLFGLPSALESRLHKAVSG